ncbi:MAG: hypothetical protein ACPLQO_02920 [Desulfotomaculales bacterium]
MNKQAKPVKQVLFWGVISLAAYLLIFLNEQAVTSYFARGGFSAIVVIVTALSFSFIHGAFANYLLEVAGIRAAQKGGH